MLDIIGIENRLTDLVGHPVDLVEEGTLGPRVRKSVNREIVRAFFRLDREDRIEILGTSDSIEQPDGWKAARHQAMTRPPLRAAGPDLP